MRSKNLFLAFVLVAVLALPMSVKAQDGGERPLIGAWDTCADPTNLSGDVKVGLAFAQSEAAAIYGVSQQQAAELAIAEINESGYLGGATLVAVTEDAGSTPETAISAFTNLVGEDVSAIIGPTLSNQAMAADPVAFGTERQDAGDPLVPVIGVSNTRTGMETDFATSYGDGGNYFRRVSLPESKVIPGTVAQVVDILGIETVGIMYSDNDQFTASAYDVFVSALEELGVDVVATETFATGDVDFTSQLTNIIAADPDAIVVSALAAEIVPLLEQARSQLGYEGPIIGGNGFNAPGIASEDKGAGTDANGVIVGGAWNVARQNEISTAFTTKYEEEYGTPADQFAVQAYTGTWVVATAIRCADSADPADVLEALAATADFETPLGTFSFDEDGLPEHEPVAQIIKDGQYLLLTEESAAEVFGN
ncbi:MAG: ABC transporter substrate-binding protein [Chloroflexi bacterium]|nr:ABC transporter substrate-binding protein [Chloroflexota bacterium]